jgi:hypothetical protein
VQTISSGVVVNDAYLDATRNLVMNGIAYSDTFNPSSIAGLTYYNDWSFSFTRNGSTHEGWMQQNADGSISMQLGKMTSPITFDNTTGKILSTVPRIPSTGVRSPLVSLRSPGDSSDECNEPNCDYGEPAPGTVFEITISFIGFCTALVLADTPLGWLAVAIAGIDYMYNIFSHMSYKG